MPANILTRTIAVCLLLVSSRAFAQDATLTGHVVDGSGAAVPGASVVLTSTATAIATETVSNGNGLFSFPSARPGTYELRVDLAGFASFSLDALRLAVGENRAVTVALQPSQIEEK